MNSPTNDELLKALQSGDTRGVTSLYHLLLPKIRKYILDNSGTQEDVYDVLQKTMLQLALLNEAGSLNIKTSLEGYGFTIARNLWRKDQKKRKVWVTNDEQSTLLTKEAELIESTIEQEKWDLFQEKLALLSENCQELFRRLFEKQPYADIARELSYASENVLRQRIFKCKKKLKEYVQKDSRYKEIIDGA